METLIAAGPGPAAGAGRETGADSVGREAEEELTR